MKNEKIRYTIYAIAILTMCFLYWKEFPEEPKVDTGVILIKYESQTY